MEKRETTRERLREYVRIDRIFEEENEDERSDFDNFCTTHSDDIDITLDCIEAIEKYMKGWTYDDFEKEEVYREVAYHFDNIKQIIRQHID